MNDNILLTEANYKDKYPPLGLMKISTYHKLKGDNVKYSREFQKEDRNFYSKIYIATRFSFHWKKTKSLIKYYQSNFNAEILIGGIHASINPGLYENEFNIKPIVGSLKGDISSIINKIREDIILSSYIDDIQKYGIDVLPPDYSLFYNQKLPFNSILENNYFLRATKGCNRNCDFCDVKKICESYIEKLPISPIIKYIDKHFGSKKDILFFDDNTLMSSRFQEIILELNELGFTKGAKVNRKLRSCDFNQGMDLRLLDAKKLDLLNTICLNPIRFAFDDISTKEIYLKNIKKVIEIGIKNISVYVLFNYKDTPKDFYERLRISVNLNNEFNCRIFSFPMKYIPNEHVDRQYLGQHWTKRMIRGVQCILNSSHGIVPVNIIFFEKAFGKDYNEFFQIINMPEKYIIQRDHYKQSIEEWKNIFISYNNTEREQALKAIELPLMDYNTNQLTKHYINEKF